MHSLPRQNLRNDDNKNEMRASRAVCNRWCRNMFLLSIFKNILIYPFFLLYEEKEFNPFLYSCFRQNFFLSFSMLV